MTAPDLQDIVVFTASGPVPELRTVLVKAPAPTPFVFAWPWPSALEPDTDGKIRFSVGVTGNDEGWAKLPVQKLVIIHGQPSPPALGVIQLAQSGPATPLHASPVGSEDLRGWINTLGVWPDVIAKLCAPAGAALLAPVPSTDNALAVPGSGIPAPEAISAVIEPAITLCQILGID